MRALALILLLAAATPGAAQDLPRAVCPALTLLEPLDAALARIPPEWQAQRDFEHPLGKAVESFGDLLNGAVADRIHVYGGPDIGPLGAYALLIASRDGHVVYVACGFVLNP